MTTLDRSTSLNSRGIVSKWLELGTSDRSSGAVCARLNHDPDQAVLDPHLITLDRAFPIGEAFARPNVEPPAVEIAFDDVPVKP